MGIIGNYGLGKGLTEMPVLWYNRSMKKIVNGAALFAIALFFIIPIHLLDQIDYTVETEDIFETKWFTEPFEVLYFFWPNGTRMKFTSGEEDTVRASNVDCIIEMGKRGLKLSECLIIIHNHLKPSMFSIKDIRFYQSMRRMGFDGLFLLYTSKGVLLMMGEE